ncbi:chromate transporter [Mycoplasma sp. CSL7503-lung]|uniref:chromate transporter n=1 Tax=Mycoplasma sp. CSL7503-lung TaxID=536372 RepID=UPI0021D13A4E|nr:chromate transporter [Mycoplasma sp. CSL7503-lung]MCU4706975.1 chromate transporter [Mycoplasma sp. CSL7503-lung]
MKNKENFMKRFWSVFILIIKVTFVGFGGGNALLPIIKKEVVDKKNWFTKAEFDDVVIVTNMIPGASVIETISYISVKRLGKFWGSVITLIAILPHVLMAFGFLLLFKFIPTEYIKVISVGVLISIIAFLLRFAQRYIKQSAQALPKSVWIPVILFTAGYCLFVPSPYNIPFVAIISVSVIYFIFKHYKNKGGK